MRVIITILFVAAPLLTAQGNIEGTVISSVTRVGIGGVAVKYYTPQGVRYETMTGGAGTFRIAGMKAGEYRSSFEKEGYQPLNIGPFPRTPTVRVSETTPVRVSIELSPRAKLRGYVRDENGNAVSNVRVELRPFELLGIPAAKEAVTAKDGSFEFTDLDSGSVVLSAHPKEDSRAKPSEGVRSQPVSTFFPSEIEREQAQQIRIRPGADEPGYEIRLRNLPVYRVRGVVLDETGKPAEKITVRLGRTTPNGSGSLTSIIGSQQEFRFGPTTEMVGIEAVTGKDGVFELPSVRQGEWVLLAESEFEYQYDTRRDVQHTGVAKVFVSRDDVDNLEIRLAPTFDFSATVEWQGDPRPPGRSWARVLLQPVEGQRLPVGKMQPDGGMRFEQVATGRYRVSSLGDSPGFYLAAVVSGGRNALGEILDLGPNVPPLHIVYKSGAASVRATVDRGGAATVILFPASASTVEFVKSAEIKPGTAVDFADLRPGDYYLAAFDRIDPAKLSNPTFLQSLSPVARLVRLEESVHVSVELRLNRWAD